MDPHLSRCFGSYQICLSVLIVWKSFSFKITYVTKVMVLVMGTVNNEAYCCTLSLNKENKIGFAVVTLYIIHCIDIYLQ